MNPDIKLKDYFQLGNHESQNTFVVGEDGEEVPAISLNEFNDESTPGSGTDKVITGIEEYHNKKLSRQTAKFFSLGNPDRFSKNPSEMNFVIGNEGFFSSVMEGIKEIIEKIVKFIMGGINWLVESGKSLLGLSANTERREKKAKDNINTYKDMENYLRSVGFPENLISLENCVKNLSPDFTEAFKAIYCDQQNAKSHLDTLGTTVGALNGLQKDLSKLSINISKTQSRIKEKIIKMFSALKSGKNVSTVEYRDLVALIPEAILELDFKKHESRMMAIVEKHYKKAAEGIAEIKNPEFAATTNTIRNTVNQIKDKMQRAEPSQLVETALQMLNAIAEVRGAPGRTIMPCYISLDYAKLGHGGATELQFIENSVVEGNSNVTQLYLQYLAETAKYVTLVKEINSMLQVCVSEQSVYYNFFTRLSFGVASFIEGGIDAFVKHINAVNSNLPESARFVSTGKHLFKSDDVADSMISQLNSTLETLHNNGDILKVHSRIKAFQQQMAG